jgi:hypothetical protein
MDLTVEQRARIERNRNLAVEKLKILKCESTDALSSPPPQGAVQRGNDENFSNPPETLPRTVCGKRRALPFPSANDQSKIQRALGCIDSGNGPSPKYRVFPASISGKSVPLPRLEFSRTLLYCRTLGEVNEAVSFLRETSDVSCLGFDIEWFVTFEAGVPPRKVATIQLCNLDYCAVFQTSSMGN